MTEITPPLGHPTAKSPRVGPGAAAAFGSPAPFAAEDDPEGLEVIAPQSPGIVFWTQMKKSPLAIAGGVILALFYLLAFLAPFAAPYPQEEMDRQRYFHPPQRLYWLHADDSVTLRPYVRETRLVDPGSFGYQEDATREWAVRFFVRGAEYNLLGLIPTSIHLYGVDPPGRIFLLGSDSFGRDVLSRLLYGAQISLTVGVVGITISFTLGLLLGGVAGYFGGFVDTIIMRVTELLLSIPSLYLIIALRAVFPIDLPSRQVYLGIVAILAFIGWAGLARVIRGLVLSMRQSDFVTAAEALGFSRLRVIARHVLPNTMSYVIVAATLSIPGYILGEVILSFLGVGVQEPSASWGNILNQARSIRALTTFPWLLFVPGTAIFLTVMAFNFLGDGLRDALDPRRVSGGRA
jgi:peptide/nickel transport system permease protein